MKKFKPGRTNSGSANYEKFKRYYDKGYYNAIMLSHLVEKGKLTADEYNKIVGVE